MILRSANERIFSAGADIRQIAEAPSVAESANEYRQRLARTCYEAILDCVHARASLSRAMSINLFMRSACALK